MAVIQGQTKPKLFTYEDYMREVEAGIVDPCEYVDGVRQPVTAPNWQHQDISGELTVILRSFARKVGGVAGAAPLDIMIREQPFTSREPDLYFASRETLDRFGKFPTTGAVRFPIDLVVEILSPSERRRDIEDKIRDYASVGIRECWIVSPQAQDITVLVLHDGSYRKADVFITGEKLSSPTILGLEFELNDLFGLDSMQESEPQQ